MKKGMVWALLLVGTFAGAASFKCSIAKGYAETQICGNPRLSHMDDVLADNYQMMQAPQIGKEAVADLRKTQKQWLKQRNRCTTQACLIDSYLKRIDEVCNYPAVEGVHPPCSSSQGL